MPCPEKFKESLIQFGVNEETILQINNGYEELVSKSPRKEKAAYFKRAVDILNNEVDRNVMQDILEWNACCKGGAREKASKQFAKSNSSLPLSEKIAKIKEVPNMGNAVLNSDGTITVHAVYFLNGDRFSCACSNFNKVKRDYSVSKDYCFCCGGHFKHHYEIMLGIPLKVKEVVSSPLDSNGKNPCVFTFEIL